MEPKAIARTSGCSDGNCPTIYRAEPGVVVQGNVVTDPAAVLPGGVTIPAGEGIVVIPEDVFEHLVEQYLAEKYLAERTPA